MSELVLLPGVALLPWPTGFFPQFLTMIFLTVMVLLGPCYMHADCSMQASPFPKGSAGQAFLVLNVPKDGLLWKLKCTWLSGHRVSASLKGAQAEFEQAIA